MHEGQGGRRSEGGIPSSPPLGLLLLTVLLSLGVHAGALALACLFRLHLATEAPHPLRFAGTTFELAVSVEPPGEQATGVASTPPQGSPMEEPTPNRDQRVPVTPLPTGTEAPAGPTAPPAPATPAAPAERATPPAPATPAAPAAPAERATPPAPATPAAPAERPAPPLPPRPTSPTVDPQTGPSPNLGTSSRQRSPGVASTTSPTTGAPPGGSYGESTPLPGTVDLYRAFLKTLPLAAKNDEEWTTLPDGPAGQLDVQLRIDAEGRLQPLEISSVADQEPPAALKRAVLMNRQFLLHGRFSLGSLFQEQGIQRLHVSATIRSDRPDPDRAEEGGVARFGQVPLDAPTGVYFAYYSGRRVDILVERLPPKN